MYGVYVKDDEEMFVMSQMQVFRYLHDNTPLFHTYSVHTDGNNVSVWEPSAGANGKLAEVSVEEFFYGFEEEGLIIRKISQLKDL